MLGVMSLNSFTNLLHAAALGTYAYLVYAEMLAGNAYYTPYVLYSFLLIFVLKLLGVLVHLRSIEQHKTWSTTLWTIIAVGVCVLNYTMLVATAMEPVVVWVGTAVTVVCAALFINSLRTELWFAYIAGATAVVYLLVALFTCGALQLGLVLIVASNVAWVLMKRVPYLYDNSYHNDIYHIALIVSTYVLFDSVSLGLWQGVGCL